MPIELHPHQVEGVAKMHNGCILYGDVGVGKTITSLAYYFERACGGTINEWGSMKTPKDLYVITTAKVRDGKGFDLTAAKYGIHEDRDISTNNVTITVDSWNNLHKYVGVKDAFFIFDEQRVVGYGAWSRAFIKIARDNEWILLSATPGDTWLDYIPVFIANGWYRNKTDFLDQHVIWTPRVKYPKVLRYQNVGDLVRRRNEVLVRMSYERHTVRHPVDIQCDYDQDIFDKVVKRKWHVFENRPLRDAGELFSVMRKVVNSDPSRLTAVRRLSEKHSKLIVFYNFDYELEELRTLAQSERSSGTSTQSTSESAPDGTAPTSTSPRRSSEDGSPSTTHDTQWDSTPWTHCSPNCPGCATTSGPVTERLVGSVQISADLDSSGESFAGTMIPNLTSRQETTPDLGEFSVAEWNGHKHEEIPTTERWLYLVQYRAGAEGWNCVETDAICFYSQTYSYRDWWQAHGRIDRLNTPFVDLFYYHLISNSIIDKAIRRALKAKKSFNERDLAVK